MTKDELISQIEKAINQHRMTQTGFGRKAVGDGNFVFRLRNGEGNPTLKTIARVQTFIESLNAPQGDRQ